MDQRPHAAMVLSNGYGPDVRAEKEAHTLAAAGWRVTVIAWDREGQYPVQSVETAPEMLAAMLDAWPEPLPCGAQTDMPGPVMVRRVRMEAGFRSGRRLMRAVPGFWWRALHELRRAQPDIVHAHDLDTLPLAYLYGKLYGVPVLFDAREYYPGMVRDNVGATVSGWLERLDRWLAPRVDGIITVGDRLAARYRDLGGRVWIVHNTQPLPPDTDALEVCGRAYRRDLGVPDEALLVTYVGFLNPERLLTPLLDAVPEIDHVWCMIGGTGPNLPQVQAAAARCDRIRALGWVPLADVPTVVAASDVVYYGLDARNQNAYYFMPNLAFYALAAGRPVLTTPVGEIAEVVQREGCGVVLESATREAAGAALRKLCDASYRATVTSCARDSGQRCYHWAHAATQLLDAYAALRDVKNC